MIDALRHHFGRRRRGRRRWGWRRWRRTAGRQPCAGQQTDKRDPAARADRTHRPHRARRRTRERRVGRLRVSRLAARLTAVAMLVARLAARLTARLTVRLSCLTGLAVLAPVRRVLLPEVLARVALLPPRTLLLCLLADRGAAALAAARRVRVLTAGASAAGALPAGARERSLSSPRSWATMAGFSSVETSCETSSPRAMARSRRRMILPERVFGSASAKRISSGLAIGLSCFATQARSSSVNWPASAVGRSPRQTT